MKPWMLEMTAHHGTKLHGAGMQFNDAWWKVREGGQGRAWWRSRVEIAAVHCSSPVLSPVPLSWPNMSPLLPLRCRAWRAC